MKVLVTYVSRTGNTKKVAQAIFKDIKTTKEIKDLDQVRDLRAMIWRSLAFPLRRLVQPNRQQSSWRSTQQARRLPCS